MESELYKILYPLQEVPFVIVNFIPTPVPAINTFKLEIRWLKPTNETRNSISKNIFFILLFGYPDKLIAIIKVQG